MSTRSQDDGDAVYVPPSGPPRGPGPSREIISLMGQENMFRMCEAFYAELEKSSIRGLFPEDMPAASTKLASFLVQICGGPPLFNERHGQPMMRARHLEFAIDEAARRTWLDNFKRVLATAPENFHFPRQHLPGFIRFLEEFSAWMVNRKT
jgi:hemoglobin